MMYRKFICIFLISIFILSVLSRHCFAGDPLRKFGRGITNTATGWCEVFKEIGRETASDGDLSGLFIGPIKGFFKGIGRTAVGIYEVLTFLIPAPENYEPIIEPEFVFNTE